jgi:dCMP deaminase
VYLAKWDLRFLELAWHISAWSKDPSTKVGCVVVGADREIRSTGFNGFPRGIDDRTELLMDKELKYPMICHAEENAIMHAARIGVPLKETTLYVNWHPCSRCVRSMIQAGIKRVVFHKSLVPERWRQDFDIAAMMLEEAEIEHAHTTQYTGAENGKQNVAS